MTEEQLKKRIEELEAKLGIGKSDPTKDGYAVLVKLLVQQNDYLNTINIKTMISSDDKNRVDEYKRAKELWEKLPDMIKDVNGLKYELKIEGELKQDLQKPISAKEIANGSVLPD